MNRLTARMTKVSARLDELDGAIRGSKHNAEEGEGAATEAPSDADVMAEAVTEVFDNEFVDAAWAPQAERDIADRWRREATLVSMDRVECRQRSCKIEVRYPSNQLGKEQMNDVIMNYRAFQRKNVTERTIDGNETRAVIFLTDPSPEV
jgi:hypothetical protein